MHGMRDMLSTEGRLILLSKVCVVCGVWGGGGRVIFVICEIVKCFLCIIFVVCLVFVAWKGGIECV